MKTINIDRKFFISIVCFLLVLAMGIVAMAGSNVSSANVSSANDFSDIYTDELEYMSDDLANEFIGFIYNVPKSRVSDEMRSMNDIFNYLTGRLQKGTDEYEYAQVAFLITVESFVKMQVEKTSGIETISSDNLVKLLEEKAGVSEDNITDEFSNEQLSIITKSLGRILSYAFDSSGDSIDHINAALKSYEGVAGVVSKAEDVLFAVETIVNSSFLLSSHNSKMAYDYYSSYVNVRGTGKEYVDIQLSVYSIDASFIEGITGLFSSLGFGNSWEDVDIQRMLRTFGEFTYHSKMEMQSCFGGSNQIAVSSVKFAADSFSCFKNQIVSVKAVTYPANATVGTGITYSSSNTSIVSISADGKVTPVSAGAADIIATSGNGIQAKCHVTVLPFLVNENSNGFIIADYCGSGGEVSIPSTITNIPIVEIGDSAFAECDNITSISIPNSVTKIGASAFYGCDNLTTVSLSSNITSIAKNTFAKCINLKYIQIPEKVKSVESYAFAYCDNLSNVEMGDSVIEIGDHAFYNCKSLVSIELSNNLSKISEYMFSGCSSLKNVDIPSTVSVIDDYAFYNCERLVEVTIPEGIIGIPYYVFYGCDNLIRINMPGTIKNINIPFSKLLKLEEICIDESNQYYYSIEGVLFSKSERELIAYPANKKGSVYNVPDGTKKVDAYGMFPNNNLEVLICPESVTSVRYVDVLICNEETATDVVYVYSDCDVSTFALVGVDEVVGDGAVCLYEVDSNNEISITCLYGSSDFTEMFIPKKINGMPVTNIAFKDDPLLMHGFYFWCVKSYGVDEDNEYFSAVDGVLFSKDMSKLLDYPRMKDATEYVVPDGVKYISENAFGYCTSLSSVSIPQGIAVIEDRTFSGCTSLVSVNIPHNVTSIGERAFYYCSSLTNIDIPQSVTNIGKSAFFGCKSLTSINIPHNVTSIGEWAFYDCSSLTNIDIPQSVTNIGKSAFCGCESLTSINIPTNVSRLDDGVFCDCTSLSSINIPNSVTSIEGNAFQNCSSLSSIVIPDSVTSIGNSAFLLCSSLSSVVIPDSVTNIGTRIFGGCDKLSTIKVDDNNPVYDSRNNCNAIIETATNTLISGCSSTIIPSDVTSIGYRAFYSNSSLSDIIIPDSVTSVGDYAFYNCSSMTDVYYTGTEEQWNRISIGTNNDYLKNATIHYNYKPLPTVNIVFSGASLTLQDDIFINYKANESLFTEVGYENPYVIIELNGEEYTISEYRVVDGEYVFDFTDISSANVNDTITATLYATFDGTIYHSESLEYSLAGYCDNEGHTWKNGACLVCGEACEHSYTDDTCTICGRVKNYDSEFAGASITLGGNLGVNFGFELSEDVAADENAKVVFTLPNGTKQTVSVKDAVATENGYYVFTCEVNAIQMSSIIKAQVVSTDYESEVISYSVVEYAEHLLSEAENGNAEYAKYVPLVKAMLNYGAYSQVHFGYATDNLANNSLADEDKMLENVSLLAYKPTVTGKASGVRHHGSSLTLDSETAINLYFVVEDEENIPEFYVNGALATPVKTSNGYRIEIEDIPAQNLDDEYVVTVGDLTVKYSAFSYGYSAMYMNDENVKNVIRALYAYNQAAETLLNTES